MLSPVETEPTHVFHDRFYVFDFFLDDGVVETEVAAAAELPSQAEIRQIDLAWPICR